MNPLFLTFLGGMMFGAACLVLLAVCMTATSRIRPKPPMPQRRQLDVPALIRDGRFKKVAADPWPGDPDADVQVYDRSDETESHIFQK